MDFKKVQSRFKHEGLSFLTIPLPAYGKDFQKGLDQGLVDRSLFQGFTWRAGLPLFLGGFLDRVFDRGSGILFDEPDVDAILAIRQLSLLFSKILLPCTDVRERRAMSDYIKCEQEVRRHDSFREASDIDDFRRVSSLLFASAFSKMDRQIYYGEAIPKHGPGSTADKLRGNAKYNQRTWTDRLESVFPAGEFLLPSWSYFDQLSDVDHLEPGAEIPVKVISVPKTQKTPRIIAVEPTAMQYAQQAVLEIVLKSLSESDSLDKLIGFLDQEPNQLMAREGSLNRELATLD